MLVFLGLLLVFAAVILWEVPALVEKKLWGELVVFTVLVLVGIAYGIGLVIDYPLPNPMDSLRQIVAPFTGSGG